MHISELIDLGKYPLDCQGSYAFERMLGDVQDQLRAEGCAVLKGFVHRDGVKVLAQEAARVAPFAHRSFNRTNPYFTRDDPSLPEDHPARTFFDRSNGFVPADNFGPSSPLRLIYEHPDFMPFVRAALEEPEDRFFRYDDPLADVIINTAEAGNGFPWHFDTNNFTVTLAIQNADRGGEFEYVPHLRSAEDENFAGVAQVLAGHSPHVRRLVLEPGDLQIFKGRYALHRVAPLNGSTPRHVGIFSFVEKRGMCGSPERTKQLYGRVLPRHIERAGQRNDSLMD